MVTQTVELAPIRSAEETLNELGKKPSKRVCQPTWGRNVGKGSVADTWHFEGGRGLPSNDRE